MLVLINRKGFVNYFEINNDDMEINDMIIENNNLICLTKDYLLNKVLLSRINIDKLNLNFYNPYERHFYPFKIYFQFYSCINNV